MPRVLDVERLENKFAALTRARESITTLSSWIMSHSEFCNEIVEEWLTGLSKNFNALNMFYVANDVIMNSGKKRVPQYRISFSKVLETAVGLPNVKEVKKDVMRMLNIWCQRGIFDDGYCEALIEKLNTTELQAILTEEPLQENDLESEADIISVYKKDNLFDKIAKLEYIDKEVKEKEEILQYADEPEKPNYSSLDFRECHQILSQVEKYCDAVKELIWLAERDMSARKSLLKELKYTDVFYSHQNEDVKKVVHAYKIYGKKIKNVAKNLEEKREILTTTTINSPETSDDDVSSPKSPDDFFTSLRRSSFKHKSVPDMLQSSRNLHSKLDVAYGASYFSKFPKNFIENLSNSLTNATEEEIIFGKYLPSSLGNGEKDLPCKNEKEYQFNEHLQESVSKQNKTELFIENYIQEPKLDQSTTEHSLEENLQKLCSDKNEQLSKEKSQESFSGEIEQGELSNNISLINIMKECSFPNFDTLKSLVSSPACKSTNDSTDTSIISEISPSCSFFKDKSVISQLIEGNINSSSSSFQSPNKSESKDIMALGKSDVSTHSPLKSQNSVPLNHNSLESEIHNKSAVLESEDTPIMEQSTSKNSEKINILEKENSSDELLGKSLKRESIKRKIDLLLKTKGKKHCQNLDDKQNSLNSSSENIAISENINVSDYKSDKNEILKSEVLMAEKKLELASDSFEKCNSFLSTDSLPFENFSSIINNPLNEDSSCGKLLADNSDESNIGDNCMEVEANNDLSLKNISDDKITIKDLDLKENVKDQSSIDKEVPSKSFLSISTELLKRILEKNIQSTPDANIIKGSVDLIQNCDKVPLIPQDSFFSKVCEPNSLERHNSIPGLDISETKKEEKCITLLTNFSEINDTGISKTDEGNDLVEVNKNIQNVEEIKTTADKGITLSPNNHSKLCFSAEKEKSDSFNEKDPDITPTANVTNNEENNTDTAKKSFVNHAVDFDNTVKTPDLFSQKAVADQVLNTTNINGIIEKPKNIIQTLNIVLQSFTKYKTSKIQKEHLYRHSLVNVSKIPTSLPLEKYLKLYRVLKSRTITSEISNVNNNFSEKCSVNNNPNSHLYDLKSQYCVNDFCTTTNVLHGSILSTSDSNLSSCHANSLETKNNVNSFPSTNQDNLEVADMDCDSE